MKSIFISAGHGGDDPGRVVGEWSEHRVCTWLRDQVTLGLLRKGCIVKGDGWGNINQPLKEVLYLMKNSDVKLEFHCNASDNPQANGTECLSLPSLKKESQHIAQTISRVLGERLRGEYGWTDQSKSAHGKLAFVEAGGIIVEVCFITNPESLKNAINKRITLSDNLVESLYKIIR